MGYISQESWYLLRNTFIYNKIQQSTLKRGLNCAYACVAQVITCFQIDGENPSNPHPTSFHLLSNSSENPGSSPDDPDAIWNVTLQGVTYRDHVCILMPLVNYNVFPMYAGKTFETHMHISDLTMSDNVGTGTMPLWDSLYVTTHTVRGTVLLERARFERNGNLDEHAGGTGGVMMQGAPNPVFGFRPTFAYVSCEWDDNGAG